MEQLNVLKLEVVMTCSLGLGYWGNIGVIILNVRSNILSGNPTRRRQALVFTGASVAIESCWIAYIQRRVSRMPV